MELGDVRRAREVMQCIEHKVLTCIVTWQTLFCALEKLVAQMHQSLPSSSPQRGGGGAGLNQLHRAGQVSC